MSDSKARDGAETGWPATKAEWAVAEASWLARLKVADEEPHEFRVPTSFYITYGMVAAVSLGGGVVFGARAFEGSVAYEALDKLEKSTMATEAQAMRMATRAFGLGSALVVATAAASVFSCRYLLGWRSATDAADAARRVLGPVDAWLTGWGNGILNSVGSRADSCFDTMGDAWRRVAGSFQLRSPAIEVQEEKLVENKDTSRTHPDAAGGIGSARRA